ncbi:MAG: ribbon-helix-helix protein, CopG family [bacterium]|nr:ribbon-helix-helix domain-containing protein [Bacteroidota bacterium]
MTITARLKEVTDKKLRLLCNLEGVSRTEIIKESIEEYFNRHVPGIAPYEMGKNLFGRFASSKGNLSINGKKYLKKKLREKHIRDSRN